MLRVLKLVLLRWFRLAPGEVAGVLQEYQEVAAAAGVGDGVTPLIIFVDDVDEGGQLMDLIVLLLTGPDVIIELGI